MASALPKVPSDTIIPVHYWDDTALCRSAILYDLMRFDNVLDVEKLKLSLEKLLNREGWRKLGARVRLNVVITPSISPYSPCTYIDQEDGKLEYHIPACSNQGRIPFSFHHEALNLDINDHPQASRLRAPSTSVTPHILCHEVDVVDLMRRPGDPEALEDYLDSDLPLLGIRIITFHDATLITISWPHIVLDGSKQLRSPILPGRRTNP